MYCTCSIALPTTEVPRLCQGLACLSPNKPVSESQDHRSFDAFSLLRAWCDLHSAFGGRATDTVRKRFRRFQAPSEPVPLSCSRTCSAAATIHVMQRNCHNRSSDKKATSSTSCCIRTFPLPHSWLSHSCTTPCACCVCRATRLAFRIPACSSLAASGAHRRIKKKEGLGSSHEPQTRVELILATGTVPYRTC